jgi:histidine ammonia-lyase
MKRFLIHRRLNWQEMQPLMNVGVNIALDDEMKAAVQKGKDFLDQKLSTSDDLIYGINTGFGALCNVAISKHELKELQYNLIRSHACGMGEEVPASIVRLMLILKAQSLAYGHSGVAVTTLQRLIDMFNADMLPVVYQLGSLGASGDLAPLAHLALPLIGEGEVVFKGKRMPSATALQQMDWQPLSLEAKEGLALLNGTQFMSAYGVYALLTSNSLCNKADFIAAASLDAFDGRLDPFHPSIQEVRGHPGQIQAASNVRNWLIDSELQQMSKTTVQDPYSFRCIPQVHGASRDVLGFVSEVFAREINAVSDNPNIFPDEDLILSGGNFHGQPLAMALDQLGIALAEIGSISERRIFQLVSGSRGLPPFLIASSGLNSGMMIPQYTAASIASQNKQLAFPSSIDNITSSNGQEDHVSMGANAATKLSKIIDNLHRILAIEWMIACQALDFRAGSSGSAIEKAKCEFRNEIPFLDKDRTLHPELLKAEAFVKHQLLA